MAILSLDVHECDGDDDGNGKVCGGCEHDKGS